MAGHRARKDIRFASLPGPILSDGQILAGILRRMLASEDVYVDTNGLVDDASLCIDGWLDLTPEEGEVVWRVLGRDV